MTLASFFILAFALGFKHSYDFDHLIAVSNILRKSTSIKSSWVSSIFWAMGHMLTAIMITIALFIFKESFFNDALPHFEKIAGLMLIALGILSLKDFFNLNSHRHSHESIIRPHPHFHTHMFGIGIVHGLASNDELLALFAASLAAASLGGLILALGLFSFGVVIGMVLFATAFSYPLIKLHSERAFKFVSFGTGNLGILYGALMLFSIL